MVVVLLQRAQSRRRRRSFMRIASPQGRPPSCKGPRRRPRRTRRSHRKCVWWLMCVGTPHGASFVMQRADAGRTSRPGPVTSAPVSAAPCQPRRMIKLDARRNTPRQAPHRGMRCSLRDSPRMAAFVASSSVRAASAVGSEPACRRARAHAASLGRFTAAPAVLRRLPGTRRTTCSLPRHRPLGGAATQPPPTSLVS